MIPKAWARAISLLVVSLLLTGLYIVPDFATMEVKALNHGGVIAVNEIWKGQINHIILTNVTIPENITVEIEGGADVLFEDTANTLLGPLSIFVNGTLIINGTPEDRVLFTSRVQAGKEAPGDWNQIYYNSTSNDTRSRVSYATFQYGIHGLFLEDSNILVENSEFSNMSQEGILSYASSPIIRNCTVHYNTYGIWAESGGAPHIENNTIEWNWYDGIYGVRMITPTIINNRVWNNLDDGIHIMAFTEGLISNNTVVFNNDNGVVLNLRADMLVKDNNISLNGDAGVWMNHAAPTIQHNLITNNTRNGVRIFGCKVEEGCPTPLIVNNTIAYNNKEVGLYPGIYVEESTPSIMKNYIAFNDAEGIYMARDSGGNISHNAIVNNYIGIVANRSTPIIEDNNPISGNWAGIYVKNHARPYIRDNVLTNNKYGIYIAGESNPEIYRNVIASASGKDLYVGDKEGKITFYENRGESVFNDMGRAKLETGEDIDVGNYATPAWGDIDDDGLNDLLVGNLNGNVHSFRNLGNGYFRDMGRLMNETPLTTISKIVGMYCHPFVTDWDLDGDLDLFCGVIGGEIFYLTNNGDDVFTNQGKLKDGFSELNAGPKAAPFFMDWHGDGDRDLIAGEYWGSLKYYENQGIPGGIAFTYSDYLQWWDGASANDITNSGPNIVPWLVDWNGDSFVDLITGTDSGVYYWKRTALGDLFEPRVQFISSLGEMNARATDWNSDGYYDLITGGQGGSVKYYMNNGGPDGGSSFTMVPIKDGNSDLYLPGGWSSPFPIDFDGDGILDLIVGDKNGDVWFFRGTAAGSPVMNFVSILTGSGTPQYIQVGPSGTGQSRPYAIDWNNDDKVDLVVGESTGWVWLFTNDGDGTFSTVGRAHNETGVNIRTMGVASAPSVADWDGDRLLDLIVGDSNGYIYFWKRNNVPGDPFNFTNMGRLQGDGGFLQVSSFANPFIDDWNADGDLDILIGEDSGRVMYYENDGDGTLSFKGNLSDILGGDLKVSENAAPQGVGYYGSLVTYKGGHGIYSVDSSPDIRYNVMIKGGDGNKSVGQGEAGGTGIYMVRSDATIYDNKNISGGSGGLGQSDPTGDVIGGQGGHGIYLDNSTGWIENNVIIGNVGGEAEAGTNPYLSIGGAGGNGVFSINDTTTYIANNVITAGEANVGVNQTGAPGAGIRAENHSQPFIENCVISGEEGVYADNATPFIVNSTIQADQMSFNVSNHGHAIALNTTFDKTKTYYGDNYSVLENQWFLHAKVVDRSGFEVKNATVTVERNGFAYQGHLSHQFAPIATNAQPSPTVVDWDEDGLLDVIVGENDGDILFVRNIGNGLFETPVTLLRGSDIGSSATRPFVYDLDFDLNIDVIIGDNFGKVYWYKKNGPNLELYDTFKLVDDGGTVIGDVEVSFRAAPSVGDWGINGYFDGYWDLVVGDGTGYVHIFARQPGSFLNFTYAGMATMADGTPVTTGFDAVPYVVDWNGDGVRDLVLSASGRIRLYLGCENGTLLYGGLFMANRTGLQPIQLPGGFSTATVVDFNGDGDLDLIAGATNTSLINTGNIEYFESNKNGDSRTFVSDDSGEVRWIIVTEFIESDRNRNHFGDDPGDKVYYTPHMIGAKKRLNIGCASPQPVMTQSQEVLVVMCQDVTLPVVVETYPRRGQQGIGLDEDIWIKFSKPMNTPQTGMVTSLITDTPVNYNKTWSENDTLLTIKHGSFDFDTHYTVRVRGDAKDKLGLLLDGNYNGVAENTTTDDYYFSFHTKRIDPHIPPTAVLEHWPEPKIFTFIRPVQLLFDGRNSTDDVSVEYWQIEGYNGTSQLYESDDITNATTPFILFDVLGEFCVNLTVWDGVALSDTDQQCIWINDTDINDPEANAGPDQVISSGEEVTFEGSGSWDDVTPTDRLNFTWEFNNSTADVTLWGMNPRHSGFHNVGSYLVNLTVRDEAGNWDMDDMTVLVITDRAPNASAGPAQSVCAETVVTLDASNSDDDGPLGDLTFNWTFDDGEKFVFLQGMVVTHQFNMSGDFEITLEVTDESGNWDIDTTWVNVTFCISPRVVDYSPIGPDKLVDSVIWANFTKDMEIPDLYFSFTLEEFLTGAPVVGIYGYDNMAFNMTFTPTEPLRYGTAYEACFNASVAMDTEGYLLDGDEDGQSEGWPTDDVCWTFKTVVPPSVGSTVPENGEQNVPVQTNIEITFNEPMDNNSVPLAFTLDDGTTVWDSTDFIVNWSLDSYTFYFTNFDFGFSTDYNVNIDSSIARSQKGVYLDGDMDGIPEGPPGDDYPWTFTTEASPTVTGVPTGTDVPLNVNIVMTFNKVMDWDSVESAITITEGVDVRPLSGFGTTASSDMSKTFTIYPNVLIHGTTYNIELSGDFTSGAKDFNGNSLDGDRDHILEGSPNDDYSWEFTTQFQDFDPPYVVSTSPQNGALDVPLNEVIDITFNELMDEISFPASIFVKIDTFTFQLGAFGDFEWNDTTLTLSIYPEGGLQYDSNYTFILSGETFTGVVDLAGNSLDGNKNGIRDGSPTDDYRFWFTTPDPVPPHVISTTPFAGETNVSLETNITATFDDDMDESTISTGNVSAEDQFGNPVNGELTYDAGQRTLTLNPDENLRPGWTYTVNITNVKDDDGNVIQDGYYVWSFTTVVDDQPPIVTIVNPADGSSTTKGDMVFVVGTAYDNSGIETLQIRFGDGSWIDIEDYNSTDGTWSFQWDSGGSSSGTVLIEVQAYDYAFLRGSAQVSVNIHEPAFDLTWIVLIVLAVIIAVVATLIFLLMWRKRRTAVEEEVAVEEMAEEEEELPEEEGEEAPEGEEIEEAEKEENPPEKEPSRRIKKPFQVEKDKAQRIKKPVRRIKK